MTNKLKLSVTLTLAALQFSQALTLLFALAVGINCRDFIIWCQRVSTCAWASSFSPVPSHWWSVVEDKCLLWTECFFFFWMTIQVKKRMRKNFQMIMLPCLESGRANRVSLGFVSVCIILGRWWTDLAGSRNNCRRSVRVNKAGLRNFSHA